MKLLGGIFIVAGTTIGAGMLALPVSTAFGGFFPAFLLFFLCWLIMLATSFFFLDVNLSLKGEPNFIFMAGKTLGKGGKVVNWILPSPSLFLTRRLHHRQHPSLRPGSPLPNRLHSPRRSCAL